MSVRLAAQFKERALLFEKKKKNIVRSDGSLLANLFLPFGIFGISSRQLGLAFMWCTDEKEEWFR